MVLYKIQSCSSNHKYSKWVWETKLCLFNFEVFQNAHVVIGVERISMWKWGLSEGLSVTDQTDFFLYWDFYMPMLFWNYMWDEVIKLKISHFPSFGLVSLIDTKLDRSWSTFPTLKISALSSLLIIIPVWIHGFSWMRLCVGSCIAVKWIWKEYT